ncbi:hypothetical protein V7968_36235 [Nocardia vulneris]|uniref:hypothetical protein n=1 Tax=Nocardia vulneris TaxID=1141657 RepID=UPI0030D58130
MIGRRKRAARGLRSSHNVAAPTVSTTAAASRCRSTLRGRERAREQQRDQHVGGRAAVAQRESLWSEVLSGLICRAG